MSVAFKMRSLILINLVFLSVFSEVESSSSSTRLGFEHLYKHYADKRRFSGGMYFGDKVPPYYDFHDKHKFKKMYDEIIVPATKEVIGSIPFNNVDSLIQVYKAFRNQTLPFSRFYQQFQVNYVPRVTTSSILLEIMNRISKTYDEHMETKTKIEDSLYLAAMYDALNKPLRARDINKKNSEHIAENQNYASSLVGLLRFTFDNRRGYVIFSCLISHVPALIIMEDGRSPYEGEFQRDMDAGQLPFAHCFLDKLNVVFQR